MIYSIPIIGWAIGLFFHTCLAIPFYFAWNWLAPKFFFWLPAVYQQLGFLECIGLFVILSILKMVMMPTLARSSSESKSGKEG